MNCLRARSLIVVSLVLGTQFVSGPQGTSASSGALTPASAGRQLWVSRLNGPGRADDYGRAVAVSPDGSRVFVTGYVTGSAGDTDFATVAYDASSGTTLWTRWYKRPGDDYAWSVAVSPDGARVFVTGESPGIYSDYATVAYDAGSGTTLWKRRYNGPGNADDFANAIAVSADGATVFVTGDSGGLSGYKDYATIAYDASTGGTLWVSRYNGPANRSDVAVSIGVSPDGSRVVVTGSSSTLTLSFDYATVAYDASSGTRLWARRYDGPAKSDDYAYSVAVSPDGSSVFVTGTSKGSQSNTDYATVAYNLSTGSKLWVGRYDGPGKSDDSALSVAVSPGGTAVFVTGESTGASLDYATLAFDTSTGAVVWARRYDGPARSFDSGQSIAVSPDGASVFVTGYSVGSGSDFDYATIAYDAASGTKQWLKRYNGPGNAGDTAYRIALRPTGATVTVTGGSLGSGDSYDITTVTYRAT